MFCTGIGHSVRCRDIVPRLDTPGTAGGSAAKARPRRASAGSVAEPRPAERLPRPGGRPPVSAASEREKEAHESMLYVLSLWISAKITCELQFKLQFTAN